MSLIFIGSYTMLVCVVLVVVQPFAADSEGVFSALCITRRVSVVGFGMLVSTVLFRMMRVYRVFTHFGKTGRVWRNKYLFVYILVVSSIPLLEIILIVVLDRRQYGVSVETDIYNNPPIKVETLFCDAKYRAIWDTLSNLYVFILLVLLIAFALLTRKIDRKHFKDTKKIIMFSFVLTFTIALCYPVIYILDQLGQRSATTFTLGLLYLTIAVIAQVFLLDTKVFPACYHHTIKKHRTAPTVPTTTNTTLKTLSSLISLPSPTFGGRLSLSA